MMDDPSLGDPSPFAQELPCPRCGRLATLLWVDTRLVLRSTPPGYIHAVVPEARYHCSRRPWPHQFGRRLPGSEPRPDEDTCGLEPYVVGWQRSAWVLVIVVLLVLDALVGRSIPALVQFAMAIVMMVGAIVGLAYRGP
jgi:hypothetical protein